MGRRTTESESLDCLVGQNIRIYRMIEGLTRQRLAESVGVSYQRVYKYETGQNSVAASTLYAIARVLGVEVARLYDDPIEVIKMPNDRDHIVPLLLRLNGKDLEIISSLIKRFSRNQTPA